MRDPGHGFASPIFDAQATFRKIQDALARPGIVQTLDRHGLGAANGLPLAATAILLTLADYATPVFLPGGSDHPAAHWLAFHTGARTTAIPEEAQFAFLPLGVEKPLLRDFPIGEDCYPDRSATVLVECIDFMSSAEVRLKGPGILESHDIAPSGLRPSFWQEVQTNAARFPLGVDLFLIADDEVIGLPRTCRVMEMA